MPFKYKAHPNLFLILSPPRSGARQLANLLNQHPQIICHGEIFHQDRVDLHLAIAQDDPLLNLNLRNCLTPVFIENMLAKTKMMHPAVKAIGCKLMLYPHQLNQGLEAILAYTPRVILLQRSNLLAWFSSYKIALETQTWFDTMHENTAHQIHFDAAAYQDMLEHQLLSNSYTQHHLQKNKLPIFKLDYAEREEPGKFAQLLKFLNLSPIPLPVLEPAKELPPLLERFHNPEAVIQFAQSIQQMNWLRE